MLRPALMALVAATFAGVLMASTAAEAQKAFPGGGGGFRGGSIGGGGSFRGGSIGGGGGSIGSFRGGSVGSFRGGSVGSFRGGSVGSFRGGSVGSFRSGRVGSFRSGTVGLRGASIGVGRSGFRSGRVYAGSNVGSWRHGGFRHRFRHGRRLAFIGAPFVGAAYWGGYPYDYGYAGYGDECLQRRLVPTPWGLQWRLVDVCYQYGY